MRYAISPVLFDGVDSYAAAISFVPETNTNAVIPTHTSGPDIGKPKYGFALCAVASTDWPAVIAVSNAFVFPVYPLDARMDGMEAGTRTAMVQSVEAYNLDGNGLNLDCSHLDAASYRSVVESLLHQFEPAYSLEAFTVGEVPA